VLTLFVGLLSTLAREGSGPLPSEVSATRLGCGGKPSRGAWVPIPRDLIGATHKWFIVREA